MQIGDVIRKYRKGKNMTQEEMARRLGVTAPAVNKWENGNSLPDISLLSPIARLLNISIDDLLSHKQALSNAEADRLTAEINEKLKAKNFSEVFGWMKQCLAAYPDSHYLILSLAQIFDAHRQMSTVANDDSYDDYILDCYKRVLESEDETLVSAAAEALYYFYLNKADYSQADKYLSYFPLKSPERKQKQALVWSKTGRQEEAYKIYEELLYAGYQSLSLSFNGIFSLALAEGDFAKARMISEKTQKLAQLFEFGEYHEVSVGLELATLEKNAEETLHIMERMLTNLESIYAFTSSPLFTHMAFKTLNKDYLDEVRNNLIDAFRDEETYAYLKDNQKWRSLVGL